MDMPELDMPEPSDEVVVYKKPVREKPKPVKQIRRPEVINVIGNVPPYNPLTKDPGELEIAFERRTYLYEALCGIGFTPDQADTFSRLKTNIDIEGVSYDEELTQVVDEFISN